MAGLKPTVDRMFVNNFQGDALRQIALPGIATGVGVATVGGGALAYGAWVDLALAAAITTNSLIVGVYYDGFGVGADTFTIDIGSCMSLGVIYANAAAVIAAGALVIAGAHRQEVRCVSLTPAQWYGYIPLQCPVFIPAGVGILARNYSVAGGNTINVTALVLQNF